MRWWLGLLWMVSGFAEVLVAPADKYKAEDWEVFREHQGFYPYLCEMGYRALADHVIDPNFPSFDPAAVQAGDSIYCAVWYLEWFAEEVHDKIKNPYVLITCDVGAWLPSMKHLKLIYDPKVVCWFAKNMLFTHHTKFFQLPMGHFYYLWAHRIPAEIHVFNELVAEPKEKDILLYLNHTERDHGRRIPIADMFWNQPYCTNRNRPLQRLPFSKYWEELSRSYFVISPLGLEVDCTRTWECFSLGSIPIVEHSYLDPLYEGLPILLIDRWEQINEAFLKEQYEKIMSQPHYPERAFMDYWAKKIAEKQEAIRQGDLSAGALESNLLSGEELTILETILTKHHKERAKFVYYGYMTALRPFQLAEALPHLPQVAIVDMWTQEGIQYIRRFAKNPAMMQSSRVKICKEADIAFRGCQTVFLDLTHFRHKLYRDLHELKDFEHSLEKDILRIYQAMPIGGLLIGNQIKDPYVAGVINRLKSRVFSKRPAKDGSYGNYLQQICESPRICSEMKIQTLGEFWFCIK